MTTAIAEMPTIPIKQKMSPEEYLRLERATLREKGGKYEFFNQNRILMAGGTLKHSSTVFNAGLTIGNQLRQAKIKSNISIADTKVVSYLSYKNYFYPDIVVVEGKPYCEDAANDIVMNPTLIVEVLSESTEAFDRGDKFKSYRRIKSLKEYILIDSKTKSIEQFYKDEDGIWRLGSEITEGSMTLYSFPIELSVDDIYFDVEFETETI